MQALGNLVENCFSLVQHLVFSHVRLFWLFLVSIPAVHIITIIGIVYLFVLHTSKLLGGLTTDRFWIFLVTLILFIFRVTILGWCWL